MLRELGMKFQLNTVFTAKNIHEAPQMLKNAIDLGAIMFYTFMLVPTGRGAQLDMLSPLEREDVLYWLHDNSTRIAIKTTEAPSIDASLSSATPSAKARSGRFATANSTSG